MPNVKFASNAHSESQTKIVVKIRDFEIIIDEPENQGGSNDGANPVEYILAAFSGCLNVVGHKVAKEMGIKLNGLKIDMEGQLDPAKFMGMSDENRAGYSSIKVIITPDTDADESQLNEWLKVIENRCPVSDNLQHATPINIELG